MSYGRQLKTTDPSPISSYIQNAPSHLASTMNCNCKPNSSIHAYELGALMILIPYVPLLKPRCETNCIPCLLVAFICTAGDFLPKSHCTDTFQGEESNTYNGHY